MFNIGEAIISYKSFKQTCVDKSNMEYEFIVLDKVEEEAKQLQNILEDIPSWSKHVSPICKHNIDKIVLSISYQNSKNNIVDPLIKSLTMEQVNKSLRGDQTKTYI